MYRIQISSIRRILIKYLYGPDYGYRSGINKTMTKYLSSITNQVTLGKFKKKRSCFRYSK